MSELASHSWWKNTIKRKRELVTVFICRGCNSWFPQRWPKALLYFCDPGSYRVLCIKNNVNIEVCRANFITKTRLDQINKYELSMNIVDRLHISWLQLMIYWYLFCHSKKLLHSHMLPLLRFVRMSLLRMRCIWMHINCYLHASVEY